MNKFFKILTFFVLIFAVNACSYKPIFLKKNYDFKIEDIVLSGSKDVNSIINNRLKFFGNNNENYNKTYLININTDKRKKIISKDSKGDPLKFEISITTSYQVINLEKTLIDRKINKKNNYNNDSDKFKLEQSEKIIVENLSEKIVDEIVSSLINLNDN